MALQWIILTYVVAAEAATAILLTLPTPKVIKSRLVSLVSLILQPSLFIVPFSAFQLMDIYWKKEHRLICSGETCTASERDRYEKSVLQGHSEYGGGGEEVQRRVALLDTPYYSLGGNTEASCSSMEV